MALGFRGSGIGASSRNSPPPPPEPQTSETDEEMQAMSDVAMKSRSPQTPIPGCFETLNTVRTLKPQRSQIFALPARKCRRMSSRWWKRRFDEKGHRREVRTKTSSRLHTATTAKLCDPSLQGLGFSPSFGIGKLPKRGGHQAQMPTNVARVRPLGAPVNLKRGPSHFLLVQVSMLLSTYLPKHRLRHLRV